MCIPMKGKIVRFYRIKNHFSWSSTMQKCGSRSRYSSAHDEEHEKKREKLRFHRNLLKRIRCVLLALTAVATNVSHHFHKKLFYAQFEYERCSEKNAFWNSSLLKTSIYLHPFRFRHSTNAVKKCFNLFFFRRNVPNVSWTDRTKNLGLARSRNRSAA